MFAPYVRSVVVRDAAVTTWMHVATSPIRGVVDERLPVIGSAVGAGGRCASTTHVLTTRSCIAPSSM
jgi:hypothetical protein